MDRSYKKPVLSTGLSMALGLFAQLTWAAAFTPGSLVVYRVGDGSSAVSANANAVFLDEYRPDGTLLQSLAMPAAAGSAPLTYPLTASSTGSEGLLNRSVDGQCLTVPGYAAATGTTAVAATASTATQRSVAFVDATGNVDTTTTLGANAFNTKSPRGAVSDSCTHAWLSGDGSASSKLGVWYVTKGATTSTQIYSTNAIHGIDISGGKLYASLKSLTLNTVGSGLPTTAGQSTSTITNITNLKNYRGMAFLDLQTGVAGNDTLYLANNSDTTIDKYSYDGASWTARGHIAAVGNAQGLVAMNLGDGNVALYFADSNSGNLYRAIDNSGATGTITSTATLFATAAGSPTNALFYGVALAPEASMPVSAPAAATGANATSITATGFRANWTAPVGGAAVAYYVVEVSVDNFATVSQTVMVPASQTHVDITGLTGLTHYYRVRAVNSLGASSDLTSGAIIAPNTPPTIVFPTVIDGTDSVGYPLTAGDANEPMASTGISFTASDAETAASNLVVTASSNNTAVLPNANLHLNCASGVCALTVDTAGLTAGYATVTVSVSDSGDAQGHNVATTNASRNFAISARSAADISGNTNPRWLAGRSDSSDGIVSGPAGSNYVLVADDEPGNVINLWDRSKSGQPVKVFDVSADLEVNTGKTGVDCTFAATLAPYAAGDCNTNQESDMEAANRVGNITYWTGSHSNSSAGLIRPARWRYFAYAIDDSTPANPSLTFVGYYKYLRADLVNWDHNNSHSLGADYFGLTASTADLRVPESGSFDGFNIEGLSTSPDESVGWFAFRAPLVPAPGKPAVISGSDAGRTHALIIQAPHYNDTTNVLTPHGGTYNASSPSIGLGLPIRLDLGGRGIRDIKKNAAGQYLIIAGPSNSATGTAPYDFRLFTWDGSYDHGTGLATNLHMRAPHFASFTAPNYGGAVEGIVEVPDTSNPNSTVDLISDSGDVVYYGDGIGAKDLDGDVNAINHNYPIKKSRVDTVTLGGIVSFDATLGSLTLGNATLGQTFSADTTSYTATVYYGTGSITVTPTVNEANATVTVNGVTVASGSASAPIAPNTTVTVVVTAQDGSSKTYSVTTSIIMANQSISFAAAPTVIVGGTGTVSATGGASGNAVTFTSTTAGVCSVTGSTVTGVAAGACTIAANQAGNVNYNAATQVTQPITIGMANQSISFGTAPTVAVGGTGTVTATGGASGNAVTFTSTTAGVCSVTGSTVTGVSGGTCTIAANQAGNANYNAATTVTQSIAIGRSSQSIGALGFTPATIAKKGATTTVSATATSGLAVSFSTTTPALCSVSGSTVTGLKTGGTCTIAANQAGSAAYFAAPQVSQSIGSTIICDTTTAVTTVNTCPPDATLHITGSSALGGALTTVVEADLFDTTATPIIKVLDTASVYGPSVVSAWYGMSRQYAGKRLFVVYNNVNGSAAGVSQLLVKENPANDALISEAAVVTIGPTSKTAPNNCFVDDTSTTLAPAVVCYSYAATQADMAITDVNVAELYMLETPSSGKLAALTTLTGTPLALQGFGVAVNANLYAALQTANLAQGLIPATCTAGDASAACQPSIRSADFTSLVTQTGTVKTAAALLGNGDATPLSLARGNDLSGIQAASNLFFADNPCRDAVDSKGNAIKGVLGGALDVISITDSTAGLDVQDNSTTNDIVAALNAETGYAIGVLGLGTVPGTSDIWKYVKLDRVSPNFNADGSADAYQRNAFAKGNYPFAMTFYAVVPTKAPAKGVATLFPNVISAVVNGLKDSTLHNLTGIGYLDGVANAEQSLVHRTNGNNCSPLIK